MLIKINPILRKLKLQLFDETAGKPGKKVRSSLFSFKDRMESKV